ncbi:MAG: hypothetical protein ACI828_001800 [Flavobacteriales bacterium]|jgi:hypothetical protein
MKNKLNSFYVLSLSVLTLFSCTDGGKAIEEVLQEVDRGAVLRTVRINKGEFNINNLEDEYSIELEEQDIEEGDLLESVAIEVRFVDNTPENGDVSSVAVAAALLLPTDFSTGPNALPVIDLKYTFSELLTLTGVSFSDVHCKDQFRLDLELRLTDGRVFTTTNCGGTIVNNTGFFKSPFSYLINIVEPIVETAFTGTYEMSSILDGAYGPTFIDPQIVTLTSGHSNNVRVFEAQTFNDPVIIEFSVVCNAAVITRYQKSGRGCTNDFSDQVLLGPDSEPGLLDPNDDSVLEIWYVEAFEGYDAFCIYSDFPAKFRLSKQ